MFSVRERCSVIDNGLVRISMVKVVLINIIARKIILLEKLNFF